MSTIVASHCHFGRRARGFTLTELVAVIVVLGILSAMGVARFMDRKDFAGATYADTTRSMLRYGQKVAIAQNRNVYVRLDGSNIALCFDSACSATSRVATPALNTAISTSNTAASNCNGDASWYCDPVPADVSYTVAPADPAKYFYFDQKGKPYAAADVTGEASTLPPLVISITGSGATRTVTVERETGYVF